MSDRDDYTDLKLSAAEALVVAEVEPWREVARRLIEPNWRTRARAAHNLITKREND